jgi:hypothetical protein
MTEEIDVEPWLAIRRDVHRHKRDQSTMGWIATKGCKRAAHMAGRKIQPQER